MIISRLISGLLGLWILAFTSVVAFYSPQHVMVDVTNDFGICTLQLIASKRENIAFSPYGLVSVALVLYEGSTGPSAAEIHNTLRLPWDREVTRVGFRDLHRYLKSYFSNDGFLRGLVLSKPNIGLRRNYTDLLQFYGFDVKTSPTPAASNPTLPTLTTVKPTTSSTTHQKPITTATEKTSTTAKPTQATTSTNSSVQVTTPPPVTTKPEETVPERPAPNDMTSVKPTNPDTVSTSMALPLTSSEHTPDSPVITTKVVSAPSTQPMTPSTNAPATIPISPEASIQSTIAVTTSAKPTPPEIPSIMSTETTVTKPTENTQSRTDLEVIMMTDKNPSALEILSQVSESAQTTTAKFEVSNEVQTAVLTTRELPTTVTSSVKPPISETPSLVMLEAKTTTTSAISQSGTTLDIITMTDKKPNTLEILSQVNESVEITTPTFNWPKEPLTTLLSTQPPTTVSSTTTKPTTPESSLMTHTEVPVTTKLNALAQFGTTPDVITMTDKKPNTLEIMSQVNESSEMTTPRFSLPNEPLTTLLTTQPLPTTPSTTIKPFSSESPLTTQTEIPFTSKSSKSAEFGTTFDVITVTDKTSSTLEILPQLNVSAPPTSTSEPEQMEGRDKNTGESILPPNIIHEETDAALLPTTSLVEGFPSSTTNLMSSTRPDDITEAPIPIGAPSDASLPSNLIDERFGTDGLVTAGPSRPQTQIPMTTESTSTPRQTTVLNDDVSLTTPMQNPDITSTPKSPQSMSNDNQHTTPLNDRLDNSLEMMSPEENETTRLVPSTITQSETTTITSASEAFLAVTTMIPKEPIQESNILGQTSQNAAAPTINTAEANDSADSENGITRQRRSLLTTFKTPEQQTSGSNWVPHAYDRRWGYNPSNEFWFFTYDGGENVPAHVYTAYLPFAFVPELSCLAIQLPLDDPRYSILLLLPEDRFGLSDLLYSLQWCPVRAIRTHLKMTAVYAVVPAFTVVKHVNLVPALAKLGVHSVFDPFRADLSPMTSEPHLFVRTIEQVVTVSLRKYYDSNRWFDAPPNEVQQHFVANHPFAYFVIDKETEVTLMAGTIVNPVAHNQ